MSIQPISECMEDLIGLHETLLHLAHEKTQVLIHNDVEELNRIVTKEAQLVRQITECDRKRIENVNLFLKSKGFRPDPTITIAELNKLVFKAEEKQAIQQLHEKLLGTINQLQTANTLNQQLIEQSLKFIDHSLDLLAGPPDDEPVYRNPNIPNTPGKRALRFDTKA